MNTNTIKLAMVAAAFLLTACGSEAEFVAPPATPTEEPQEISWSPNRSACFIQDQDGFTLLVKEGEDSKWDFSGGHLYPDEDPKESAIREVFEETNLVVVDAEKLFVSVSESDSPGELKITAVYRCQVVDFSTYVLNPLDIAEGGFYDAGQIEAEDFKYPYVQQAVGGN